ncbi:MAG: hypothetical protein OXE84_10085 [Rhodobacteraceae bacterium]|nr:hypothetical protein [Paracoccaceae bacterium]MCY4326798.1 hypothetical protein [Paracoccaceae bacterium]
MGPGVIHEDGGVRLKTGEGQGDNIMTVEIPGWLAATPWWVIVGLVITLLTVVIKVSQWTGRVNERLTGLDERLQTVENLVRDIGTDIKKIFGVLPRAAVEGSSPVQLTEYGQQISVAVRASEWARQQAPCLVDRLRGKEEFEIFESCVNHVSERWEQDLEFARAVRAGAYQIGTDTDTVLKVVHVELRDQVLGLIAQDT